MNRKMITVALLLVVTMVWGSVLWKVVRPGRDGIPGEGATGVAFVSSSSIRPGTLPSDAELGNYADPFLRVPAEPRRHSSIAVTVPGQSLVNRPSKPTTTFRWPNIAFRGTMRNATKGDMLAILLVDGKEAMVQQGDGIGGVIVQRVYPDSVLLAGGGERRTYSEGLP